MNTDMWHVERLDHETLDEFVDFLACRSENSSGENLRAWWEWKYFRNPSHGSDDPAVFILKEDGRIHGFVAASLCPLWIQGSVYPFYRVERFETDEKGKGRGMLLARCIRNLPEMTGGFPNEEALPLWRRVAESAQLLELDSPVMRAMKTGRFARMSRRARCIAGDLYGQVTRKSNPGPRDVRRCAVSVRKIQRFPDEYDGDLERLHDGYPITPLRTPAMLNWRYLSFEKHRHTVWIALTESQRCCGFCVLKTVRSLDENVGFIQDMLYPPAHPEVAYAIVAHMLREIQAFRFAEVRIFEPSFPPLKDMLHRTGFRVTEVFTHLAFILHRRPDDVAGTFLANTQHWYLPGECIS
jgi:hypothetical protein